MDDQLPLLVARDLAPMLDRLALAAEHTGVAPVSSAPDGPQVPTRNDVLVHAHERLNVKGRPDTIQILK
ncbi:MAG TPA: hypothetical protein VFJ16_19985 [Longimicrobium sp.]|nr:hypothetical protein [Longimicrobium sp.]